MNHDSALRFLRYSLRLLPLLALTLVIAAPVSAQAPVPFEQVVNDLSSSSVDARRQAVQMLAETGYPEAAIHLSRAALDDDDGVQTSALSGLLNLFGTQAGSSRRRVALMFEVRHRMLPVDVFRQGPQAIDPRPVQRDVLTNLRSAAHDKTSSVAVDALYTFGTLAENAYRSERVALLDASTSLTDLLSSPSADVRIAAAEVIGRLFARRQGEPPVDPVLGDALITALNDDVVDVRRFATEALGRLRVERAVQALTDNFQYHGRGVDAVLALTALARVAHASSVPLFLTNLGSRDGAVKTAAIEGLTRSGNAAHAPTIAEAVREDKRANVTLAGNFAAAMLSDGIIDLIVGALTRPASRERAIEYLSELTPGREQILSPHMPDPMAALRIDLLTAVGRSNDEFAADLAERLRNDPDPMVARAATRAVWQLLGDDASRR